MTKCCYWLYQKQNFLSYVTSWYTSIAASLRSRSTWHVIALSLFDKWFSLYSHFNDPGACCSLKICWHLEPYLVHFPSVKFKCNLSLHLVPNQLVRFDHYTCIIPSQSRHHQLVPYSYSADNISTSSAFLQIRYMIVT